MAEFVDEFIVSTGMSYASEVDNALEVLKGKKVTLLHTRFSQQYRHSLAKQRNTSKEAARKSAALAFDKSENSPWKL